MEPSEREQEPPQPVQQEPPAQQAEVEPAAEGNKGVEQEPAPPAAEPAEQPPQAAQQEPPAQPPQQEPPAQQPPESPMPQPGEAPSTAENPVEQAAAGQAECSLSLHGHQLFQELFRPLRRVRTSGVASYRMGHSIVVHIIMTWHADDSNLRKLTCQPKVSLLQAWPCDHDVPITAPC
eukprot:869736-Amphidinium_carterae.2